MIFLAVAAPTPGRVSNSCSLALFRSTFAFVPLACLPDAELASALTANANAAIVKNIATILKVFLTVPPELTPWLLASFSARPISHTCRLVCD